MDVNERIIQEYVPGKQITVAHVIAKPDSELYQKLGIAQSGNEAVGILTVTPSEASIIVVDIATKAAEVEIGFVDRFSGAVVIIGDVSSVKIALENILEIMESLLDFTVVPLSST
ncbi:BMC domain-containing protein [Lacrimispora saccharolytica]|uniref:Microcompartments protein n=1 Tax=Lacrimispora saccharolytica (strain ATCC 35040 / DSM 2544 / NRCC 2533 / WM1) TaxID=610130 RepID=D9R9P2_LACSW|nr:BMC domain-containing protein [Lacrimispora saccharolytica]ADL04092.1 microcompartments protein [[Clostridium] saccharolyticum WM1]QRV21614.1 BMC domain-containing protein [Lacrimispora saccharolytica]